MQAPLPARDPGNGHTGPRLYEFMDAHRAEIVALCMSKMQESGGDETAIADDFHLVIDQIIRALAKDAGLPTTSSLPEESEPARRHGERVQGRGHPIWQLALDFGSISDSVGELGTRLGMAFESREYQMFNRCVDHVISAALDQFWTRAEHEQQTRTTERVGFLVHELRNALGSARMALAILKRGQLDLNSRTGAVLDRSLGRLENLVNQAVLAVQLHAKLELELRPIAVTELLHELADTAIPERDIALTVNAEPGLQIQADERFLTSALSNLVQNAIKFTRSGGRVTIDARRAEDALLIEVEDECGGLAPDALEKLFTPFARNAHDRRGMGLGLAITREAVEAHGAELTLRNVPGHGCVFGVKFPDR